MSPNEIAFTNTNAMGVTGGTSLILVWLDLSYEHSNHRSGDIWLETLFKDLDPIRYDTHPP